ncbi:hypothetical protein [Enterobacter cloacae]|uniref:hypothetical protein n=1 Tax=Enterobacter cloacae TaxID=550 RepID=UPI0033148735
MSDLLSNKELINIGHQFAKAMSSSTPIIDIAKMLTRLAERLDCTTAAQRETEKQRDALAAENAGLKAAFDKPQAYLSWHAIPPTWEDPLPCGEYLDVHNDAGHKNSDGSDCWPVYAKPEIKTPATDAYLAEVRAQGVKSLSNAVQSVISERQRQQSVEGWTPEHDDEHTEGEMAEAAACYAMFANNQGFSVPGLWPWAREWWKQSGQRRDLVKAGALILAEIERIDRQESAQ